MDRNRYKEKLDWIFHRFPSVQKSGFAKDAYKPGLEHIQAFSALLGHPEGRLRTVHVAGTNGKGSVANMIAAALSALGFRVGLYTSPHILDFRERIRIIDGSSLAAAGCCLAEELPRFALHPGYKFPLPSPLWGSCPPLELSHNPPLLSLRTPPYGGTLKPPAHRPRAARLSAKHRLSTAYVFSKLVFKYLSICQIMSNLAVTDTHSEE